MRIKTATVIATGLAAVALLGGVARESRSSDANVTATPAEAGALGAGFGLADTRAFVRRLEAEARERPNQPRTLALLGLAYSQRARETGDASFYSRAEKALKRSLRLEPNRFDALLGLGSVALSRHRFADALEWGRKAERAAERSPAPLGVIGDGLLELGRYPEAFAAFDRMVARRPSVSSYARVAYARELIGDTAGAIEAMRLAVGAAGSGANEPAAFARTQLGNLLLPSRPALAASLYREALRLRPDYAAALIGLGHTEEARGRLQSALAFYRRSLDAAPSPDAAVSLGGVLKVLGRDTAAERAYGRAHQLEADFAAHGGFNVLETAMLDLDLDRNLRDALRRARIGHAARPSVEGEHVLAWALYKNGRCAEARRHSIRHLRLGTPDTDGLYHRVLIERCLGNKAAAERFAQRLRTIETGYFASPPSAFRLGG